MLINLQNLPEITPAQLTVDQAEALRYLRHPGEPAPELAAQLAEAAAAVLAAAAPRYVIRLFPLSKPENGAPIRLQGAALQLPGADIAKLLQNADSCLLFAATLGAQADELIRRAQLKDISFALLLDACASCAIESLCDQAQAQIEARCAAGCRLTRRFSPGYGDLPLTLQPQLCAALDATRRIGLAVSASGLLLPRKSVTAVIGISSLPQPNDEPKQHNCAACNVAGCCPYRRSGQGCPNQ